MGHNIEYHTYNIKTEKDIITDELNEMVQHETWREGGNGLVHPIRWYDNTVCDDYDAAKNFIEKHDNGWYDQIAVKYKALPNNISSKKLETLEKRLHDVSSQYRELNSKLEFKTFKAQSLTCKKCNSKLNKDYLHSNYCPLCRNDIRSETTKNKIKNLEEKISIINKDIKTEENKLLLKNAKIKWLVKIEYHT